MRRVYGVEPRELIYKGDKASIYVNGLGGELGLVIMIPGNNVNIEYSEGYEKVLKNMVENLSIEVIDPTTKEISIKHRVLKIEPIRYRVVDTLSLHNLLLATTSLLIGFEMAPFFYSEATTPLLVDGRAGIVRTLLKPYIEPLIIRNVLDADLQLTRLYYMLAERLYRGEIDLEEASSFLEEVGIRRVIPRLREGYYGIYVETYTGKVLPFKNTIWCKRGFINHIIPPDPGRNRRDAGMY